MITKTQQAIDARTWSFIPTEEERLVARHEYERLQTLTPGVKITLADVVRSLMRTASDVVH